MKVLSLFDGISCGRVALEKCDINIESYYCSEIKPHAIQLVESKHPDNVNIGDARNINGADYDGIDLLLGGSPCKGLSGLNINRDGLAHKESSLFYEYVRILKESNPRYFLLENVQGNKKSTAEITEILGIKPISINSKLVSAQNRPRYYWTNIPVEEPPKDRNITTDLLAQSVYHYERPVVSENRTRWLNSGSGVRSVKLGFTKINPYPKAGTIIRSGHVSWNENYHLVDGVYYHYSIRELEWLQTLPENYLNGFSYGQAYDMIGDAWTVDIISHILSYIDSR